VSSRSADTTVATERANGAAPANTIAVLRAAIDPGRPSVLRRLASVRVRSAGHIPIPTNQTNGQLCVSCLAEVPTIKIGRERLPTPRWQALLGPLTLRSVERVTHTWPVNASRPVASINVEPVGLLAVLADPIRWRLVAKLADGKPRCVCDLQPVAAVAPNLLSYHLKMLREAGLVRAQRRGRWVDYTIAADALDRLHAAVPAASSGWVVAGPSQCPPVEASPPSRRPHARLAVSGRSR
jgi:ArsR family transcriptional regulator